MCVCAGICATPREVLYKGQKSQMPVVFGMPVCERTCKREGEGQRDRERGKKESDSELIETN